MAINQVTEQGRIGTEINEGTTSNDSKVVYFKLAVDRQGADDEVDWVPVRAYGRIAENLVEYKEKGDVLAVLGSITTYSNQDDDGNWDNQVFVTAQMVDFQSEFSGSPNSSGKDNSNNPDEILDDVDIDDDDEFDF
jgi:single-strand DNA-binding protein